MNDLSNLLSSLLGLVIALGVAIGLFLLLREVVCWYWKINKTVELIRMVGEDTVQTNSLLAKLNQEQSLTNELLTAIRNQMLGDNNPPVAAPGNGTQSTISAQPEV